MRTPASAKRASNCRGQMTSRKNPMTSVSRFRPTVLVSKLAAIRPDISLLERELLTVNGDIQKVTANGRAVWVDHGHRVTSDCGQMVAKRAIDLAGRLLWVVILKDMDRRYPADTSDPFEAFDQASVLWFRADDPLKTAV